MVGCVFMQTFFIFLRVTLTAIAIGHGQQWTAITTAIDGNADVNVDINAASNADSDDRRWLVSSAAIDSNGRQ